MKKSRIGKRYVLLAAMMVLLGCTAPMNTAAEEGVTVIETGAGTAGETVVQIETGTTGTSGTTNSETVIETETSGTATDNSSSTDTTTQTETESSTDTVITVETEVQTEAVTPNGGVSISDYLNGKNNQNELSSVTGTTYTLEAPVFTKAYANTNTSAKLTWQKVSHAQGYVIYRKTGSGSWKRIKVLNNSAKLTYTDKSLKSGKTYRYKICAFRTEGTKKVFSAFSSILKVRTTKPTVKGNYEKGTVYGPVSSQKQLAQVRRVAQAFKDNYITSNMSEAQKALAVFNYVRNTCDYTWENWTQKRAGSAWGALVEGKAHCGGYSRAVKVLCDAIGLKCHYIHANSKSFNPTHRWNLVRIDGVWYVLDTKDGVFLAGTDTFCKKLGMTWTQKGLPKCSKTDHKMFFQTTKEG